MTQVRVAAREISIDGVNALLYKDEKDLLEKIVLLTKDKELRKRLGRNAMELVMKELYVGKKRRRDNKYL